MKIQMRSLKDDEWKKAKNKAQPIHEMLVTLLSNDIQPAEKLETLSNDFNIPVTETLREESADYTGLKGSRVVELRKEEENKMVMA